MTPIRIEYLLQLYYRDATPRRVGDDNLAQPYHANVPWWLEDAGLIHGGTLTPKGKMYIEALLAVPVPVETLAMPAPYPTPEGIA